MFPNVQSTARLYCFGNVLLDVLADAPRSGPARQFAGSVGLKHRLSHRPPMLSVVSSSVWPWRGLGQSSKLLLADEPTANVDAGHQQQIVDLIAKLSRRRSGAVVGYTHAGSG